jgi:hypothetical protein
VRIVSAGHTHRNVRPDAEQAADLRRSQEGQATIRGALTRQQPWRRTGGNKRGRGHLRPQRLVPKPGCVPRQTRSYVPGVPRPFALPLDAVNHDGGRIFEDLGPIFTLVARGRVGAERQAVYRDVAHPGVGERGDQRLYR